MGSLFQAVKPDTLCNVLLNLIQTNSLYHNISVVLGNIPEVLLSLSDIDINKSEKLDTLEENGNPLDLHRFNSKETMFFSDRYYYRNRYFPRRRKITNINLE